MLTPSTLMQLSDDGYVLPGLGDSGDRLFNTLH
jgi:uracil phosphoribosyltransferase